MATLELSINTNYVPDWGMWEAIRELLQNAKDAEDLGHPMDVKYSETSGTLTIESAGADLTRNTLLLGTTTKAGRDDQRGQFGEGYKLALLVFCRLGKRVLIRTNAEVWEPQLAASDRFAGAQTLTIKTRKRKSRADSVQFVVKGVEPATWASVKSKCLWLSTPEDSVKTAYGSVLRDEAYAGQLYAGGLYVGKMDDNYRFGYDLSDVSLDRDRKMAAPWSLRWRVSQTLNAAFETGKIELRDIVAPGAGELVALQENLHDIKALAERAAASFVEAHGEDAVPVADMSMARELQHRGLRPVVLTREEVTIIESVRGNAAEALARRNMDVAKVYQPDELTATQQANFEWAVQLVRAAYAFSQPVQVADFVGDNVNGTFTPKCITLARRRLDDKAQLISTLVHEVAHNSGGDGDHEHVQAIQQIFSAIVAQGCAQ